MDVDRLAILPFFSRCATPELSAVKTALHFKTLLLACKWLTLGVPCDNHLKNFCS